MDRDYTTTMDAPKTGNDTDIAVVVQNDIDDRASVYDPEFVWGRDRYGQPYVDEYLDEVATHMGHTIVKAFEEHDRKNYIDTAQHFGEVYAFLFPTDRPDEAGAGYAYALESHDVIEDGYSSVKAHNAPVNPYDGMNLDAAPLHGTEIQKDAGWDYVRHGFRMVEDCLELPESYTHRGEEIGSYAFHQTEFFRHHTVANESTDDDTALIDAAERDMKHHARNAQIVKFSSVIDDADVLDRVADEYLAAVSAHDAHTPEKQWENVERMTTVYRTVLDEAIMNEYDEDD